METWENISNGFHRALHRSAYWETDFLLSQNNRVSWRTAAGREPKRTRVICQGKVSLSITYSLSPRRYPSLNRDWILKLLSSQISWIKLSVKWKWTGCSSVNHRLRIFWPHLWKLISILSHRMVQYKFKLYRQNL